MLGTASYRGYLPNIESYQSYDGLLGADDYDGRNEPAEWSSVGLRDFGYLVPNYDARGGGIIQGGMLGGLSAEVIPEYQGGMARTPMIELAPKDYEYMQQVGQPYPGMYGLGDDGTVYQYDGLGGFFKRLFRKVKKVAKRIRKGIRKVVKRLPGGKMLLKIGGKIRKIAMKVVKPMTKFIGKYAGKLAPIAAMIPGYGTAIAAGLRIAAPIARTASKFMGTDPFWPAAYGPQGRTPRLMRFGQSDMGTRAVSFNAPLPRYW